MRELADAERIRRFMRAPGNAARREGSCEIEPQLYRFPALDPPAYRRRVEGLVAEAP